MIRLALYLTVFFAGQHSGNAQTHPVCEVCGCNWCPVGYRAGEPSAIIVVPGDLRIFSDNLTEVPCNLIENLGLSGRVPPDLCTDAFRLSTNLREVCGCPALPPEAEPTNIGSPLTFAPSEPAAAPITPEPTSSPNSDLPSNIPTTTKCSRAPSKSPAIATSEVPSLLPSTLGTSGQPIPAPVGIVSLTVNRTPIARSSSAPAVSAGKGYSQTPREEPSVPPRISPAVATGTATYFREGEGKASSARGSHYTKKKKKKHKGKSKMKKKKR